MFLTNLHDVHFLMWPNFETLLQTSCKVSPLSWNINHFHARIMDAMPRSWKNTRNCLPLRTNHEWSLESNSLIVKLGFMEFYHFPCSWFLEVFEAVNCYNLNLSVQQRKKLLEKKQRWSVRIECFFMNGTTEQVSNLLEERA